MEGLSRQFLRFRLQPLIIVYDKMLIERIRRFFEVKNSDEFLRSATWRKIERFQDETAERMSSAMRPGRESEWMVDAEISRFKLRVLQEGYSEIIWELKIPSFSAKNINTNSHNIVSHKVYIENVSLKQKAHNSIFLVKEYTIQADISQRLAINK